MQEQQFLPVNWTDGMKVNKMHFIAQDNAFKYQLAQNTASVLNDYNYGLLPSIGISSRSVKIFLSVDNQQQVQLRVLQCQAITRGGNYMQIEEDTNSREHTLSAPILHLSVPFQELKGKDSSYFIVIAVNPFVRNPVGNTDPGEQPPRLPFSMPAYELSLVPAENGGKNLIGLFHLPVGKLNVDEQRVSLDEDYIPPCSSISSHYELQEVHAGLEQFIGKMELYSLQIIQKILQKKQVNEMAAIVQKLCEHVTLFTASHQAEIKTLSFHQPPVFLINKVSSIARLFKNTLDYYIGSGKEEFLNYCIEWCGVTQGEVEGSITSLSNHQYNHLDVNAGIEKVASFTKIISGLFANLARLEYIGKRKDPGIFVNEKNINKAEPEQPGKKRGSFLAD